MEPQIKGTSTEHMNIFRYLKQYAQLARSKTLHSISLLVATNAFVSLIGVFTSIAVLRGLDQQGIALLYPLIGVLMVADQLGDLGISTAFIKVASSYLGNNPSKALRVTSSVFKAKLVLAIMVTLGGIAFSPLISLRLFSTKDQAFWVTVVFIAAFFSILSNFYNSHLQIHGQFRKVAALKIVPNLMKAGMLAIFLWFGNFKFHLVLAAFLVVPVLNSILGFGFSGKGHLNAASAFKDDFSEVFGFSKWILLSTVMVAFIGQVDLFMLSSMSSDAEVARYVGGSRLSAVLLIFGTSLVTVLLPKVSSYQNREDLKRFFRKSMATIPILALAILIMIPLAPYAILLVLGEKYSESILIFQMLCAQYAIDVFIAPLSLILYNLNKVHVFAFMNIAQLLVNIALNLVLIPWYGAVGATISSWSIRILALIVVFWMCHREKILSKKA